MYKMSQTAKKPRSLGIRIAAEFHARLVEQLTLAVNGEMNELEARLLLREVEVSK